MDIIKKKMENDIQKKILSEVRKLKEEIAEFQKNNMKERLILRQLISLTA